MAGCAQIDKVKEDLEPIVSDDSNNDINLKNTNDIVVEQLDEYLNSLCFLKDSNTIKQIFIDGKEKTYNNIKNNEEMPVAIEFGGATVGGWGNEVNGDTNM